MLTLIFVSERDFFRFWSDFGMIWEGFGKPKWMQKSIFGRFFRKRRLSQNHYFSFRKLPFLRFRAYKFNENSMKNRVRKYICFKRRFFSVFCGFLFDFVTILDGPKSSKIQNAAPGPSKNSPKSVQDDPKVDFGVCLGRIFFRRWVWGRFWKEFWWICKVADHLLILILLMWDKL